MCRFLGKRSNDSVLAIDDVDVVVLLRGASTCYQVR